MLFDKILKLSKQSLIYGFGFILSRFLGFLIMPFYTHVLTPEEYGAYALLYIFIAIMQIIYIGGMDIAFLKYYVAEEKEKQKTVYSNSYLAMTGIGLVISAFFMFYPEIGSSAIFKSPPGEANTWVRICVGVVFLETLAIIPMLRLRGDQRPVYFTIVRLISVTFYIGANIVLVAIMKLGLAGALYANLISSGCTVIVLIPVTFSILRFNVKISVLKELWQFGLPNLPAMLFFSVIEYSGRKILELTTDMHEVGLYSAGYKLGMFMSIITAAFRFAWQPFFLSEAKNEGAETTFARVFTYFFAIGGIIFMLLAMFATELIKLKIPIIDKAIIDPEFWGGLAVFPIILLAHFFEGVYTNFTVGIYVKKKTKLVPIIVGTGAIFNLGMNLFTIPRWGMMGAAWTTLASFILMASMLYFMINKYYPVPYEWGRVFKFALVAGAILAIFFYHPGGTLWRMGLMLIFPILLYLTGYFTKTEIIRFKSFLRLSR